MTETEAGIVDTAGEYFFSSFTRQDIPSLNISGEF